MFFHPCLQPNSYANCLCFHMELWKRIDGKIQDSILAFFSKFTRYIVWSCRFMNFNEKLTHVFSRPRGIKLLLIKKNCKYVHVRLLFCDFCFLYCQIILLVLYLLILTILVFFIRSAEVGLYTLALHRATLTPRRGKVPRLRFWFHGES